MLTYDIRTGVRAERAYRKLERDEYKRREREGERERDVWALVQGALHFLLYMVGSSCK